MSSWITSPSLQQQPYVIDLIVSQCVSRPAMNILTLFLTLNIVLTSTVLSIRAVFVKFQQGVRVLGPNRLLGQRPCQTRVAPPTWGKGVSQPDTVVLYWLTVTPQYNRVTQCCIETISNRQEGSSGKLKSTPLLFFYIMQKGQPFLAGGQPPSPPANTALCSMLLSSLHDQL